jgi:predicted kinase
MKTRKEVPSSTFDNFWAERLESYPDTGEFKKIYNEMLTEIEIPEKRPEIPLVVSLIGIPGAGKTTFSKLLKEVIPAVHLRSDVIGFTKIPTGPDYDYYKSYVIKHALARHFLNQGYNVIMDDNNRTRYNRERVYKMAQEYGAKNVLFRLNIRIDDALKRANARDLEEKRQSNFHQTLEKLELFESQIEEPTQEEIAKWNITYREIDASLPIHELENIINNMPLDNY